MARGKIFPLNAMLLQVVLVGMCIVIQLPSPTSGAESRSIKAALLHREHKLSPLQSGQEALGLAKRTQLEAQRSTARAHSLLDSRGLLESTYSFPGTASGLAGDDLMSISSATTATFGLANESGAGSPAASPAASPATSPIASPAESPIPEPLSIDSTITLAPGEYLMSIGLGTPVQNFVAVADTGSDLSWVQCQPCENCFSQPSPLYDASQSSTDASIPCFSRGCASFLVQYGNQVTCSNTSTCQYFYGYGGGSNTSGDFVADKLTLGDSDSDDSIYVPDFWFGCSRSSLSADGLFLQTDGLVGLGQGLISFPSQLASRFGFVDQFSYCLVNRIVSANLSSLLIFGDDAAQSNITSGVMQYTPLITNPRNPSFYYIAVEKITVNGVSAGFPATTLAIDKETGSGGTIIDSGTTITQLVNESFDPLVAEIVRQVPVERIPVNITQATYGLELCYNATSEHTKDFPAISFKLANNASWDLAFQNSWVLSDTDVYCLYMQRGSFGSISIFGNYQQQDFHVLYDRVNGQLGFVQTDCGAIAPEQA